MYVTSVLLRHFFHIRILQYHTHTLLLVYIRLLVNQYTLQSLVLLKLGNYACYKIPLTN